eukprot:1083691-Pleurochrysis_carterae.AAC.1
MPYRLYEHHDTAGVGRGSTRRPNNQISASAREIIYFCEFGDLFSPWTKQMHLACPCSNNSASTCMSKICIVLLKVLHLTAMKRASYRLYGDSQLDDVNWAGNMSSKGQTYGNGN